MKNKTNPKSEVPNFDGAYEYFLFPFPESQQYFIEGLNYDPKEDDEQIHYEERRKIISIKAHKIINEQEYESILASRHNKEINFYIFRRNKKSGKVEKKVVIKPLPKQNLQRTVKDKVYEIKRKSAKTKKALFL
jgi:hypothetical protein